MVCKLYIFTCAINLKSCLMTFIGPFLFCRCVVASVSLLVFVLKTKIVFSYCRLQMFLTAPPTLTLLLRTCKMRHAYAETYIQFCSIQKDIFKLQWPHLGPTFCWILKGSICTTENGKVILKYHFNTLFGSFLKRNIKTNFAKQALWQFWSAGKPSLQGATTKRPSSKSAPHLSYLNPY